MYKTCSRCKKVKPFTDFHKTARNKADGHQWLCKTCMQGCYNVSRNKKVEHYNAVRRDRIRGIKEQLNKWKTEQGCCICGENDPRCLDLHHKDPTQKEMEISILRYRRSWETLMIEIRKCEVLCANCHRKKHAEVRTNTVRHINIQCFGV